MSLPSTQRVEVTTNSFKKIWLYGAPFSGKTTFADQAPTPLNLNTDGNVKYVTMPRIAIKDEVTVSGRVTNRKFAWEIFKDTIVELEKGSEFETIVIDLLEDMREYCRLYMYDKLGIEHESDGSYGKGWDQVKLEFLSTIKRVLNLPYNIILLSHEDLSKDITKKTGDKITAIKPNLQDALATKVAGMVDIVARVVVEDDDSRWLSFKTKEVEFGGGRLQGVKQTRVPLSWEALCEVYNDALKTNAKPARAKKEEYVQTQMNFDEPVAEVKVKEVKRTPTRKTKKVLVERVYLYNSDKDKYKSLNKDDKSFDDDYEALIEKFGYVEITEEEFNTKSLSSVSTKDVTEISDVEAVAPVEDEKPVKRTSARTTEDAQMTNLQGGDEVVEEQPVKRTRRVRA